MKKILGAMMSIAMVAGLLTGCSLFEKLPSSVLGVWIGSAGSGFTFYEDGKADYYNYKVENIDTSATWTYTDKKMTIFVPTLSSELMLDLSEDGLDVDSLSEITITSESGVLEKETFIKIMSVPSKLTNAEYYRNLYNRIISPRYLGNNMKEHIVGDVRFWLPGDWSVDTTAKANGKTFAEDAMSYTSSKFNTELWGISSLCFFTNDNTVLDSSAKGVGTSFVTESNFKGRKARFYTSDVKNGAGTAIVTIPTKENRTVMLVLYYSSVSDSDMLFKVCEYMEAFVYYFNDETCDDSNGWGLSEIPRGNSNLDMLY